ncbi:FadR/GntR family transcriptional regulator [Pseudarthrobacter sp. NamB4]|uniref:FadR/GntR family transcriptional regulator n=1 Tax=Pseudarthrobacter sp. NamB4 TaxID=2576837 RepID=UPI0010FD57BE|nr:FCD domain-containing protein [Pseudarthrobacter sp. NamB4]TLM71618.1 FadR family transcriptional regulator [Pseudarthrobacter sp. NamB4]
MTRQLQDTAEPARLGAGRMPGMERRSAMDAVRMRIGMAISLGLLKPGERLPDQEDVALGLSVSPITARRALASLAEQGVVVRRRGRAGGTFVADAPPSDVLASLSASPAESQAVNRLVDRRLLFECAVTHYAAVNATASQLDELERLTRDMAEATDWSVYHQADERFHQLVGTASGMGTPVEVYHETLAELYDYFIPYPIEKLHKSNHDHIALVAALRAGKVEEAVEVSRKHVDILHRTMFMGLTQGRA